VFQGKFRRRGSDNGVEGLQGGELAEEEEEKEQ
jgi:hypothetical protein